MMILDLFLGFLEVGCFAFGGAYGAIPLIRDVVMSHGWLSDDLLTYMIAVSESTPGPIMVNLATYVGSNQAGLLGAIAGTLAVVLPSFLIILLITALLRDFLANPFVSALLRGVKPCVIGIVLATGSGMILQNCLGTMGNPKINLQAVGITLVLAMGMALYRIVLKKKMPPIQLIIFSALAGILIGGR